MMLKTVNYVDVRMSSDDTGTEQSQVKIYSWMTVYGPFTIVNGEHSSRTNTYP